jgi:hypothetical protein
MKKPHASSKVDAPPLELDALTLAHLAARLMTTPWYREQEARRKPGRYDRCLECSHTHAVEEAQVLFTECAAAVGLKDNPGNTLTRSELSSQFNLCNGARYDPAGMSLALATLAIQMLSAGTPRAEAVSEARGLLSASAVHLRCFPAPAEAPIPGASRWPAKLEDFYRLIMKVRDKADAQPRLRHYLRDYLHGLYFLSRYLPHWSEEEEDRRVDDSFRELQEKGFDKPSWLAHTRGYRRWWAAEIHMKKQRAGRAGYDARRRAAAGPNKESR